MVGFFKQKENPSGRCCWLCYLSFYFLSMLTSCLHSLVLFVSDVVIMVLDDVSSSESLKLYDGRVMFLRLI